MNNSKIVDAHGSKVVLLDDYRPHVAERQRCQECGQVQVSVHLASLNVDRWECLRCGVHACTAETASAAHKKIAELDATHQLWRESHTQPPPEEPEFVLVAFTSGDPPVVEVSRSEYVRAYPDEYPYWMPLPNAPTATVDGVKP